MALIGKQNALVSVLEANAVGSSEIVSNSVTHPGFESAR